MKPKTEYEINPKIIQNTITRERKKEEEKPSVRIQELEQN
jgi:hypothetical protein